MKRSLIRIAVLLAAGMGVSWAAPITMPGGAVVDTFPGYGLATYGAQWHQVGSSANSDMRLWIDFGRPVWLDKILQQNITVDTKTAFKAYSVHVAADETGMDPTDWNAYDTHVTQLATPHGIVANEWRATGEFWRERKRYLGIEITETYNGAVAPGQWGSFGDWDATNLYRRTMSGGVELEIFENHKLLDYSSGTGPWFDVQKELSATDIRLRLDLGAPTPFTHVGVSNIYVDTYQSVKVFELYCASDENDPGFDATDWNDYDTFVASLPADPQGYKAGKLRLTPRFGPITKQYLAVKITSTYRSTWTSDPIYSKANFADWIVVPALSLVHGGQPVSTIVIPAGGDVWTVQLAANYIQEYVRKATGAELPIVSEDQSPAGNLISVGHTLLAAEAGITTDGLELDSCRLVAKDNVLFLIGRDGSDDNATTPRGTCRAAVTFLEKQLGVRWFIPSLVYDHPPCEIVPETMDIDVPGTLDETVASKFAYVLSGPYFTQHHPSHIANHSCIKIRMWTVGGHTWGVWVPVEEYFNEHPEYFALIDGQRSSNPHNYLCMSNPEVRSIMLSEIRALFDQGYDWVQLGNSDGMTYANAACKCGLCEPLDTWSVMGASNFPLELLQQHPPERIHLAHKWLVDECRASHPDKTVQLLMYQPTRMPSLVFGAFGDNVVGENAISDFNMFKQICEAWRGKVRGLTSYVYWEATNILPLGILPTITPASVAEELQYYHANSVVGIYYCHNRLGKNWGLWGPVYYTVSRLMGDPGLDADDLVNEYCTGVYGETAATMKTFFDLLYDRIDTIQPEAGIAMKDRFLLYYPPAFVSQMEGLLAGAEASATTAKSRGWLRLTRGYFDYVKTLSAMFDAEKAFLGDPTRAALLKVRNRVGAFEAYRERILSYAGDTDYWYRWHPMYIFLNQYLMSDQTQLHTQNVPGTPAANGQITEPLTWDIEEMLQWFPVDGSTIRVTSARQ